MQSVQHILDKHYADPTNLPPVSVPDFHGDYMQRTEFVSRPKRDTEISRLTIVEEISDIGGQSKKMDIHPRSTKTWNGSRSKNQRR